MSEISFQLPVDMFIYQGAFICLGLYHFFNTDQRDYQVSRGIIAVQVALACLFFLTYSGFSADAGVYQDYFEYYLFYPITESVFLFKQFLFFGPGSILAERFYAPWPLKILSALGILLFSLSLFQLFRGRNERLLTLALALMLLTPGVVYLFGNGIRQAYACVWMFLGISEFFNRRWIRTACFVILGIAFHISSGIAMLAALLIGLAPKTILALGLVLSPLIGYCVFLIYGLDGPGGLHLNYQANSEGEFHWLRLAFSYGLAWLVLAHLKGKTAGIESRILSIFVATVIVASAFLVWEVPASRILLQSDLFLPVVGAFFIQRYHYLISSRPRMILLTSFVVIVAGWSFLTLPSTIITLGFWESLIIYE